MQAQRIGLTSSYKLQWVPGAKKRHLFLSFPYVCPEPVLAK
jgi:hypothetical protein